MKLYNSNASNFASKCRIVIREKGLDQVQVVDPPGGGLASSEYRRINPLGKIPALDADGTIILESEVINEYLEDRFPDQPLMPKDPIGRARVRMIARLHDLYLEPPMRALYGQLDPRSRDAKLVGDKLPEIATRLDQLEGMLGEPWAAGAAFTLADCSLAPTMPFAMALLPMLGGKPPLEGHPRLAAWWSRVLERPSVARVIAEQQEALAKMQR